MKKFTFLALLFSLIGFSQTPVPFYPTANASGASFGRVLDISGDYLAVASTNFSIPSLTGKVYLFGTNGGLSQIGTYYPDGNIADQFGSSISITNDFLAVGAPFHDMNAVNSGAVYVYQNVLGVWQNGNMFQKITAPDAAPNDHFGSFVKVQGNFMFIAALDAEPANAPTSDNGAVYVYHFNGTEWVFSQKLTATNTAFGVYHFGEKIEIENDKVIIASRANSGNFFDYNFFYEYQINGENVVYQQAIGPLGTLEFPVKDFSFSNNKIYLIASNQVNVVDGIDSTWNITTLVPAALYDQLYSKIKVEGDNMYLGSEFYLLAEERKFPLLYYKQSSGNWNLENIIYGDGPVGHDDYFGSAIAASGNHVLIGASNEGIAYPTGKAYLMDVTLDTKQFEKESIAVFPNPTTDRLLIKSASNIESTTVYSISGKLLLSQDSNAKELSIGALASGMYLVTITSTDGRQQTFKVIKN